MNIPDLTGYRLSEALEIMKAAGIEPSSVVITAPPRKKDAQITGDSRVLRCGISDENVYRLLVCNEAES